MKYTLKNIKLFAEHSNMIESVWDKDQIKYTVKAWEYLKNKRSINLKDILYIRKVIMTPLRKDIAGKLRTCDVMVGGRICPPHEEVPRLINKWTENYGKGPQVITHLNAGEEEYKGDMEKACKVAHISFEHVHPFVDGNGRSGRLIYLFQRYILGLSFEYIDYNNRYDYYSWF